MAGAVKGRRRYHSPRHAEMRRRTRAAVVDAARRLFVEQGYAGTTIEAIADAAGVSVQTVYAAFGNKRAVLWALLETSVAGDDAPRSVLDRAADRVEGVEDPRERLERVLDFGRELVARSADVHRILRGAATADPEARAALDEVEERRLSDARGFVDLVSGGRLSSRQRRHAADVLFAVCSYEVYDLLVEGRGWTASRWQHWVRDAVAGPLELPTP